MELYLDSVNLNEILETKKLGYLYGLTTTPTFMVKEGIKDIDARILEISKHVNILQVEALGNNADEIVAEAQRLINLGLSKNSTVFKIPISLEGTKACRKLTQKGFQVNLHLVYTIQQAYMAFSANATYICPLVGRLQDQGHDALGLLKECVDISKRYNYKSKIMFSSVRHIEHVKNALQIGVHACTIPWGVMKKLTENHFTTIGTTQFVEDTMLLTTKVKDVMISENVQLHKSKKILDALLIMTKSKLGALAIMDDDNSLYRVFTDGDLRRLLYKHGDKISNMYLSELEPHIPIFIDPEASLFDAKNLCRTKSVDNLAVIKRNKFYGLIDIQHLI